MYHLGSLGDLTHTQMAQLATAQAYVAKWEPFLVGKDINRYPALKRDLPIKRALIAQLTQSTTPTPPAPTPTPTPAPTPVSTGPWPIPAIFPSVPVSSPPVVTTTETPATPGIDNKLLYIGGGLLLLLLLR
jgi:hypothetical protein